MLKSIRLITFDAMNTLISPSRNVGAEYIKVATIYGLKANKDDPVLIKQLNTSFLSNIKKMNIELPNFGRDANLSTVEWWSRLVVSTFVDVGFNQESDGRLLKNTAAHLYRLFSRGNCWKLEEGAYDTLTQLKKCQPQVKLAILSNFDERLETILRDLGIVHFFGHIFLCREIGYAKPAKEIFEHALEVTKVAPSEYLHVGDDVDKDYRPVIELGGKALLVDNSGKLVNIIEDKKAVIKSLPEILKNF